MTNPLANDLSDWISRAQRRLRVSAHTPTLEHIGIVERIGDGVATVSGLPWTRLDELLRFDGDVLGLAFRIDADSVGCVLLGDSQGVVAGSQVRGTGEVIRVPVGEDLLGRVVDSMGRPLDDGPAIKAQRHDPIERPAPAIVDRDLVDEPLLTGLTAVDALIPLGRGQRELIIGDRKTGKTAIAVDTMIRQRDTEVICIYAAIGQKASSVNQVIEAVRQYGAIDRCIFVVGKADAAPGAQWITPYAACTMAEYFRDQGCDALLILDDLTKHAIVYRQLSLLLRKAPGREAYPGDVFYLHARLLERSAKLAPELGGGSLTALPIAETQDGNLSAYIPTNLISITDGQIYLEPKLFYEGQKPAVNVGMSVSRVGGHSQSPAIKKLAERLKMEYAQFLELEAFTRFGAMIDDRTKRSIEHGRRIRAILVQPEHQPLSLAEEVALLLAVSDKKLDQVPLNLVTQFVTGIGELLTQHNARAVAQIEVTGELTDEDRQSISATIDTYLARLSPTSSADQ